MHILVCMHSIQANVDEQQYHLAPALIGMSLQVNKKSKLRSKDPATDRVCNTTKVAQDLEK